MIRSFKNKNLEKLFYRDSAKSINSNHLAKVKRILFDLQTSKHIKDMNQPAYNLHSLKGDMTSYWSVSVSGNYRIIFKFKNGDAFEVDYLDYHSK